MHQHMGSLLLLLIGGVAIAALTPVECGAADEAKAAGTPAPHDPRLPDVLILGDSISIGYMEQLRVELKGKANVFRPMDARNPAMAENCEGTASGVKNIDRWLGSNHWAVIHFNWGLHDIKWVKPAGAKGPPAEIDFPRQADLPVYRANLQKLLARLGQTQARLIFATTTPVPADVDGSAIYRAPGDVPKYNEAALLLMKKHGVSVDDLFQFCLPQLKDMQQPRNVHFTKAGYDKLARVVARAIEDELAKGKQK